MITSSLISSTMASSSSRPHSKWRAIREESFFNQTSHRFDRKTCPICLSSIATSRLAILSPCSHAYCADCIRKWCAVKRTCPLCNSSFNSWLYSVDSRRQTFGRCKLPPLRQQAAVGGDFRRPARNSFFNRGREEQSRSEYSRSRPLPRRRSFRLSASEEPCVVAERVLQWRASIYRQKLRAVPLYSPTSSSRNCSRQRFLGSRGPGERTGRVNPWIKRELQAVLADPDPTIIVHVVTSLYASSLEEGTHDSDFLVPLRPFLREWTDMFWHELRCFAEISLTMETYDMVVSYERIR